MSESQSLEIPWLLWLHIQPQLMKSLPHETYFIKVCMSLETCKRWLKHNTADYGINSSVTVFIEVCLSLGDRLLQGTLGRAIFAQK